jgi:hypothetical protein
MKQSKPFLLVTLTFLMFSSWVVLSASSSSYKRAIPIGWHVKESDTGTVPRSDFTFPRIATVQCVSPSENGRWRNLDDKGEPAYIDVKMVGCGDEVLNGEQTSTSYTVRVWVRQSTGKFYGRPTVRATYRAWKGEQWLYARVPTGGYQDHLWMRAVQRGGQSNLHVLIKHESLDSKPSSSSEYWFRR